MKQIHLDWAAGRRNPSGLHTEGVRAARALQAAREKVATVLAARPDEIIFTGSGTESNNLAIFGLVKNGRRARHRMSHLITSQIEHASILEPARQVGATFLPVNREGFVDLKKLAKSLRRETILVSIIYAHNEIGVTQPIREIAKIIREFKKAKSQKLIANSYPYLHIDACQAPRFLDLNVQKLGVDLMTLNSAKISEPGVGVLYLRRGVPLAPQLLGGGQEAGRRSGTENVAAIGQFAEALEMAVKNRGEVSKKLSARRDYFIGGLLEIPGTSLNGPRENRLPNNVNISFPELDGEQIVLELDAKGVAVSTGAACSITGRTAPHVIMDAVRFTLGPGTKKSDLNYVLKILPPIIKKLNSVKHLNKVI